MDPNGYQALRRRFSESTLSWRGPAMMLFARSGFALLAQGLVAAILAFKSRPSPWEAAGPWLPVYGTLIDAGCIFMLWRLTRREGIRLVDLIGFKRQRLVRDILIGLALIPASLVFIYAGVFAAGWLIYGSPSPPYFHGELPLPAALYGVFVWPLIWGFAEQMTYNGYLLPRFQVLSRNTVAAIAIVAFVWSFQHVVMPLEFDGKFMAFRLLSSIPHSVFGALVYLRLRRVVPLAIGHAVMDGTTVLIGSF